MQAPAGYFDHSGRDDVLFGDVKLVPIVTPIGDFRVWTKRIGNNPAVKVLMLHGGPGATHEYLEACDSYFPAARIEYYYYVSLVLRGLAGHRVEKLDSKSDSKPVHTGPT